MDRTADEVTVRRAVASDRAALLAHFERLPESDRRLRFFGPADLPAQVDHLLAQEDGDLLLAIVDEPDGTTRCVAEAIAVPREDGMAEFAISVADDRRGGLGTALFEALREHAAARGIAILFGDVLAHNTPMLRLLQRRGGVTIERGGPDQVGIIVSTGRGAPPWPDGHRGRRVLIEASSGRWHGEDALRAAGHQVAVCPGPANRAPSDPCPLLVGTSCPLVEGADVIVHLLPEDLAANRQVAAALPLTTLRLPAPASGDGAIPVGPAPVLTPEAVILASEAYDRRRGGPQPD